MQFTTQVIALFGVLSSTVLASDVYSMFLNAEGAEIGSTNYDIGNDGCFTLSAKAAELSFSQSGSSETANGPYCLSAFTTSGCPGAGDATQQFENVNLGGQTYQLAQGVNGASTFSWATSGC